jgi:hypothetical protein
MKFRIYIDEVGNHDLTNVEGPNERFLSLTGVIFELGYVEKVLFPRLEELKHAFFHSHPDEPVIFHRKEMINFTGPFSILKDIKIREQFDNELLKLLRELDYLVITVVIDKKHHRDQYLVWHYDPYHYCLKVIVERFTLFLHSSGATGDVMCESRGGKEDLRLKDSFNKVYKEGSEFVLADLLHATLTSCQLKVKPKVNNISGLQIADMIAYPSYKRIIYQKGHTEKIGRLSSQIAELLEENKYYRGPNNRLWGYGKKWLP